MPNGIAWPDETAAAPEPAFSAEYDQLVELRIEANEPALPLLIARAGTGVSRSLCLSVADAERVQAALDHVDTRLAALPEASGARVWARALAGLVVVLGLQAGGTASPGLTVPLVCTALLVALLADAAAMAALAGMIAAGTVASVADSGWRSLDGSAALVYLVVVGIAFFFLHAARGYVAARRRLWATVVSASVLGLGAAASVVAGWGAAADGGDAASSWRTGALLFMAGCAPALTALLLQIRPLRRR